MTRNIWLFAGIMLVAGGGALALLVVQRGEAPRSSSVDTQEVLTPASSPTTIATTPTPPDPGSKASRPTTVTANPISQPTQRPEIPIINPPAPATTATTAYPPPVQAPRQVAATLRNMIAESRSTDVSAGSAGSQSNISANTPTASTPQGGSLVAPSTGIVSASQQSINQSAAPASLPETPAVDSPSDVLEIQIPPGARLPAALANGPQDQELSPAQLSLKETVALDFLNQTAAATPGGGDLATWNRLAIEADQRLRKMIGHDAFNRMALSASQEALEQQLPPTPPTTATLPQEAEVVTNPAPISSP